MTYEEYNEFCKGLVATSHVVQWGGSQVWKVGGKLFSLAVEDKAGVTGFTFKASELDFEILSNEPGFRPAPYLASRGFKWIQQYGEPKPSESELRYYIVQSHRIVALGLSKKKQRELGLNLES